MADECRAVNWALRASVKCCASALCGLGFDDEFFRALAEKLFNCRMKKLGHPIFLALKVFAIGISGRRRRIRTFA